jgi:hypothetical protein
MTVQRPSLLSPPTPTSSVSTEITTGHVYVALTFLCNRLPLTSMFSASIKSTPRFTYLPSRTWRSELCARPFNIRAESFPFGLEASDREPPVHPKHPLIVAPPRLHNDTPCSGWTRCRTPLISTLFVPILIHFFVASPSPVLSPSLAVPNSTSRLH